MQSNPDNGTVVDENVTMAMKALDKFQRELRFQAFLDRWGYRLILVVVGVFASFVAMAYSYHWQWTGFLPYHSPPKGTGRDFQREKTLWDWLQLLVIPFAVAGTGLWFGRQERKLERWITTSRERTSRESTEDTLREARLSTYLDRMSDLLVDKQLRAVPTEELQSIARARTLTTLESLDGKRKAAVIRFLYEAHLIDKCKPIVDLTGANLDELDLGCVSLPNIDLRGVHSQGANFTLSDLSGLDMRGARLTQPKLDRTTMINADLRDSVWFLADLRGADLTGARSRLSGDPTYCVSGE